MTTETTIAETVHRVVAAWKGDEPGSCGFECLCGDTFDGFDSIAEAEACHKPLKGIVAKAVDALACFGDDLTREDADKLLSMWRDRRLLSPQQRRRVLDLIEPERDPSPFVDYLPEQVESAVPCLNSRCGGV